MATKIVSEIVTSNELGEPVRFALYADFSGYWNGLVVTHPDTLDEGEPAYVKSWEDFLEDYPWLEGYETPPTFHDANHLVLTQQGSVVSEV